MNEVKERKQEMRLTLSMQETQLRGEPKVILDRPVRLLPTQREQAAQVLVRAFLDDPAYRFVFPGQEERTRALRRYWNAVLEYALVFGQVSTTPDVCGVACWLPSGRLLASIGALAHTRFATYRAMLTFSKDAQRRFVALGRFSEEIKKRVAPNRHLLLGLLGVNPETQHQGIGTKLVLDGLSYCDSAKLPCYLDTATESNLAFYQKHGFKVVHSGQVPGCGPRIWAMLRMPSNAVPAARAGSSTLEGQARQ